ncbi:MAG: DUF1566 domain-containing protein [Puniceicoccaceae bacterium]
MNRVIKIIGLSIVMSTQPVSAEVVMAPEVVLSPSGMSVSWQGKGTLFASDAPGGGSFVEEATESPHLVGTLQDRWFQVVYDVLNYAVVDTNQAQSYDTNGDTINPSPGEAYYGQDAIYAGTLASYTDNGNGTVTDNNTGLMWQQVPPEAFYTWEAAQAYAESLVLGGHDDWRLPTMKESISLADFTGSSRQSINRPYIDTAYFTMHDPLTVTTFVPASAENPNRPKRNIDGQFWSSNAYVGRTMNNNSSTFGFNFIDGRIKSYPNGLSGPTGTCFVRCVRGGNAYGENNYIDNGDGTITDLSTGLMWMKGDSGEALDWIEALNWAENLEHAGYDDWRLPNPKELHTLVDYTRAPDAEDPENRSAAIDPIFELTEMESWYWTSSSLGDDLFRWAIYICFGQASAIDSSTGEPTVNAHGAGAMRSDPKTGDPAEYAGGHGPQLDQVRIFNYVRPVRTAFTKEDLEAKREHPNILLLIVDDWGIDSTGLYNSNLQASLPPMPTIDNLARQGLIFNNAFAQPTCSPTRANILTGRYSFRHGIGAPATQSMQLTEEELTLPEVFQSANSPYALASFGKWHLTMGGGAATNALRPNTIGGWPYFQGSLGGGLENYFLWDKVTNGSTETGITNYATSETVDDAAAWIQQQGDNPWFCWIGFNASHTPFHRPPDGLHSYNDLPDEPTGGTRRPAYEAALEALDTEIARLLESVDLTNTNIIVIGDNGTPGAVVQVPFDRPHSKGSLYEGGTHVPMFITGPAVKTDAPATDALVHCVDLFKTCLDLAGISTDSVIPETVQLDSGSLVGILSGDGNGKTHVLMEQFGSTAGNGRAIRDDRFKYILFESGEEELYDLQADANEQVNLLESALNQEESQRYAELMSALAQYK